MKYLFFFIASLLSINFSAQTAEDLYQSGLKKNELKDYKGAIQDYTKAIGLNNTYKLAYLNRGNSKSELNDYIGAIEDYTKVIEIDPKNSKAYYNRGLAKRSSKLLRDKKGACLDWSKASELGDMDAYNLISQYCK